MNLLEMYKQLSIEEKQEFVELILKEINKKAVNTTFLEQVRNFEEAIGGKPLDV